MVGAAIYGSDDWVSGHGESHIRVWPSSTGTRLLQLVQPTSGRPVPGHGPEVFRSFIASYQLILKAGHDQNKGYSQLNLILMIINQIQQY